MTNSQKRKALASADVLREAHEEIKNVLRQRDTILVQDMLAQCQELAVVLGEYIEKLEGEEHVTVLYLEEYCEVLFQIHAQLTDDPQYGSKVYKILKKQLIKIENSIKNDIPAKIEIVFFPYKASMWDSLESVYLAAKSDPDCEVYCVPIPYYDLNPDRSFRQMNYEGKEYPDYVEITDWQTYDLENRKPDVAYIHSPYDDWNLVTSVHPRYYSSNIKKYAGTLVYIPYYSTSGGMSEAQRLCPAYIHADYIVIQSLMFREYFDENIPEEKFLPFGSPKFDSVIRKCNNPPEPPEGWRKKMSGKKVYFYNTSINGMLKNTEIFLEKMKYVFEIFKGREDVCLLWRPHPLLESTFDSMRITYKSAYNELKTRFINEEIGIYDTTPDIENTIALSDVYIGDAGTSVISLFGVVGKPIFIFNNNINTLPAEDDWRGENTCITFHLSGDDRYQVTKNNQLWFSEKNDYHYKFYMDLGTGFSRGGFYKSAVEIENKIYVMPHNAQHLLVIEDKKIRRIDFEASIVQGVCFGGYGYNKGYIYLLPFRYPFLVRFDIRTEEIQYIDGIQKFNIRNVGGEWRNGGTALYENKLVFASPEDNQFLFMDIDTFESEIRYFPSEHCLGTQNIIVDGDELWILPLNGMMIFRWNPKTGEVREYGSLPQGFQSLKWPYEIPCSERPFGEIVISREGDRENILISPRWGNMYLSLDKETGEMKEWKPPLLFQNRGKNGYFTASGMGGFLPQFQYLGRADCRIWYAPERKLYSINIDTKQYEEIEVEFDLEELKRYEPGFMECTERMPYCLNEGAFNSLKDLLDGHITGNPFDRKRQLQAFSKISADIEGTCGWNVHQFVKGRV